MYDGMLISDYKRWKVMTSRPPGDWWADVDAMPDSQIHTIYMRMLNSGQIK